MQQFKHDAGLVLLGIIIGLVLAGVMIGAYK